MQWLILIILYMAYISVGISDSLLGSTWPSMYEELNASVSYAGIVSMIIAIGTIVSNLCSFRLIKALGFKRVLEISFVLSALSLVGFSRSSSFMELCICAVPYGLGIGAISNALIKYVSLYYKSQHMSWLHCSWGIGSTAGPFLMGRYLLKDNGWHRGYMAVCMIHITLIVLLFASNQLWSHRGTDENLEKSQRSVSIKEALKITGGKEVLLAFFSYSSVEALTGLWASSYLVLARELNAQKAASITSLFYLGITAGRFFSGFIVNRIGNRNMVRIGQCTALIGVILLALPFKSSLILFGLLLTGIGYAPVYPGMLYATPECFGRDLSQAFMGIQLASAYIGSTFFPPVFGLIAEYGNIKVLYPLILIVLIFLLLFATERANKLIKLH